MKTDLKPLTIYPIDMWPEKLDDRRVIVYYKDTAERFIAPPCRLIEYGQPTEEDYAFMIIPSPEEAYNQVKPRDWENMTIKELREFNDSSDVQVIFYSQNSQYIGYCLKGEFSNDPKVGRFKSYSEIDGIIKELQS